MKECVKTCCSRKSMGAKEFLHPLQSLQADMAVCEIDKIECISSFDSFAYSLTL